MFPAKAFGKDTEFTRDGGLAGHGSRTYKERRRVCVRAGDAARKCCQSWDVKVTLIRAFLDFLTFWVALKKTISLENYPALG